MSDLALQNAFEPTNLKEAMEVSARLAKSGLVPEAFRNRPDDVLLVVMAGKEMGFSFVQSLRSFYSLKGKLAMYADAMIAVCLRHPDCECFRMVESTEERAIYETKRKGSELVRLAYTMEQAKRSGLQGQNQNYTKHPAAMLRARCGAALARIVYPDAIAGIYDPSEIEESPPDVSHKGAPAQDTRRSEIAAVSTEPAVTQRAASGGDVVDVVAEAVKAPVVSEDQVAPPAAVPEGAPEFSRPEFDDNSPEQKAHLREGMFKLATFPSGSMRGQFLEAAPVAVLEKTLRHMEKAQSAAPKDVLFTDALRYWIAAKSDDATWAETPAK